LRRKDAEVKPLDIDQLQLFSVPIFQKSEPTALTTIPQVQICAITPAAVTTDRKAFLQNKFLESEGLTTIATEQSNRTANSENHSSMRRLEDSKEIKVEALPMEQNTICKLEEIQPLFSKANTKFLFAEYGKPSAIGIYDIDDTDLNECKATPEFK
jgi:uncharacterized membrane protein YqiK